MFETVQDYMYEHEPRRRCARTGPVHNCEYSIMWKVLHIFHGYVASDRAVYTPLVRGFATFLFIFSLFLIRRPVISTRAARERFERYTVSLLLRRPTPPRRTRPGGRPPPPPPPPPPASVMHH